MNLYSYVGNDPASRTDPSGLCWELVPQFAFSFVTTEAGTTVDQFTRYVWECIWRLGGDSGGLLAQTDRGDPGGSGGTEQPAGEPEACQETRITDSVRRNTEWNAGMGLGFAQDVKLVVGRLNIGLFHAYGGQGGNLAGETWTYISGGGPALELQVGRLRLGYASKGGETRWDGHGRFEESSKGGFFGWEWADTNIGKFGGRSRVAVVDLGVESDLRSILSGC